MSKKYDICFKMNVLKGDELMAADKEGDSSDCQNVWKRRIEIGKLLIDGQYFDFNISLLKEWV